MGQPCSRSEAHPRRSLRGEENGFVTLHVYDLGLSTGTHTINKMLKPIGTGAFHCGVEVYGWEWSYSAIVGPGISHEQTGIFWCHPKMCEGHRFRQSVFMGPAKLPEGEVLRLMGILEKEWKVGYYDIVRCNCCHFSNDFCQRLGVGSIPRWVMSLSGLASTLLSDKICCQMDRQATFSHAKTRPNSPEPVEIITAVSASTPEEAVYVEDEYFAELR